MLFWMSLNETLVAEAGAEAEADEEDGDIEGEEREEDIPRRPDSSIGLIMLDLKNTKV